MNKIRCIRCTTGAPASSIVRTSKPSPAPASAALDRLLFGTSPRDVSDIRLYCQLSLTDRARWFTQIYTTLHRDSSDIQMADMWARLGLQLFGETLPYARSYFKALDEDADDPAEVRAQLAAMVASVFPGTADPFAGLRTTRKPQPKEASCL